MTLQRLPVGQWTDEQILARARRRARTPQGGDGSLSRDDAVQAYAVTALRLRRTHPKMPSAYVSKCARRAVARMPRAGGLSGSWRRAGEVVAALEGDLVYQMADDVTRAALRAEALRSTKALGSLRGAPRMASLEAAGDVPSADLAPPLPPLRTGCPRRSPVGSCRRSRVSGPAGWPTPWLCSVASTCPPGGGCARRALVRQALGEFRARRPEGLAPSRAAEVARIDPRMPKLRAWLDEVDRRDEAA